MTAPDTVIWSALLASAAVPGILNPVVLMQKLRDGSLIPWSWGSRFKDGSLRYLFPKYNSSQRFTGLLMYRVDIPVQALNLFFNGKSDLFITSILTSSLSASVTHPVVSQVNPHVHLFFFAPRGSAGKPVAHRKGKGASSRFKVTSREV